ncbi:MAG: hypothetical protein IJU20_08175 [Clostridia bacterium]|nr:hypothetical protein [Clostridia bacterium]
MNARKRMIVIIFLIFALLFIPACGNIVSSDETESRSLETKEEDSGNVSNEAKENNDRALKQEYSAVDTDSAVGLYACTISSNVRMALLPDQTFWLNSTLGFGHVIRGTWRLTENNHVGLTCEKVSSPFKDSDNIFKESDNINIDIANIKLSFDFLNEDVLVLHYGQSSEDVLNDLSISVPWEGGDQDLAFEREEIKGKEKNDAALKQSGQPVTSEKCVGSFRCPLTPMPFIQLYDDQTFAFRSLLSSYKTTVSGTYSLDDNNHLTLHCESVWPDYSEKDGVDPTKIVLSFDFLNEDVLLFHYDASDKKVLSDLLIFRDLLSGWDKDVAFIRFDLTSG